MARTQAVLGAGARLSDFLSASLLARVYPAELIKAILDEQGVNSQRVRRLPATVTAYYCMALSLYPEAAYEEVFSVIAQGLRWQHNTQPAPTIAKSSVSAAQRGASSVSRLCKNCIDAPACRWPIRSSIPMLSMRVCAWSPSMAATSKSPTKRTT